MQENKGYRPGRRYYKPLRHGDHTKAIELDRAKQEIMSSCSESENAKLTPFMVEGERPFIDGEWRSM